MTPRRTDVKPFEYVDVGKRIPNYTPGKKWGAQGEPFGQMQAPLAPEESLKHMVVPRGFHVELFASRTGDRWQADLHELGRARPAVDCRDLRLSQRTAAAGAGHDRIRICEDTDGDGRADKFTVFAEKLSIPTSLTFARGGVIVFDGTKTVFLKDTNGDDVADQREVLFGGWAQGDTHGGPSNMQYGLDNWIWAMQGYNRSRLEVGREAHEFRQGFFRFKPDGSKLEFIRSTDNNTWGLGISEEGIVFGSTANHNPSVYMPIPNRYYESVRGWAPSLVLQTIADSYLFKSITDKVRQVDHFGGYTAAAGHALYTARSYPHEYWNRTAFVCEPTGHLVGTFVLQREGSDFHSTNPFNLAGQRRRVDGADHGRGRTRRQRVGHRLVQLHRAAQPDADRLQDRQGIGVRDRPARQEAWTDLSDRLRRRQTGASKAAQVLLAGRSDLKSSWRRSRTRTCSGGATPQRLLVERGQLDVVPALCELARDPSSDELGLNVGAIHALWTMHGLGALDGSNIEASKVAMEALAHRSPGVRRNAVQVLPKDPKSVDAILKAKLLKDSDAQVRLAALLALADQPSSPPVAQALIAVFGDSTNQVDPWISDAAVCAAAKNSDQFLWSLASVEQPAKSLISAVAIVAEHRARSGPFDSIELIIGGLPDTESQLADAAVQGLAKGWPKDRRPRLSPRVESDLEQVAQHLSPEKRAALVRLATRWGSKKFETYAAEIVRSLSDRMHDVSLSIPERIDAARELVVYRPVDTQVIQSVLALVVPRTPPELAIGLIRARGAERVLRDR